MRHVQPLGLPGLFFLGPGREELLVPGEEPGDGQRRRDHGLLHELPVAQEESTQVRPLREGEPPCCLRSLKFSSSRWRSRSACRSSLVPSATW